MDFNIIHKLETFKPQKKCKAPLPACCISLSFRLHTVTNVLPFPKTAATQPFPFLCSLNTNMKHHNSLC